MQWYFEKNVWVLAQSVVTPNCPQSAIFMSASKNSGLSWLAPCCSEKTWLFSRAIDLYDDVMLLWLQDWNLFCVLYSHLGQGTLVIFFWRIGKISLRFRPTVYMACSDWLFHKFDCLCFYFSEWYWDLSRVRQLNFSQIRLSQTDDIGNTRLDNIAIQKP